MHIDKKYIILEKVHDWGCMGGMLCTVYICIPTYLHGLTETTLTWKDDDFSMDDIVYRLDIFDIGKT